MILNFIGGPYDGYQQTTSIKPSELIEIVYLPFSEGLIKAASGESNAVKTIGKTNKFAKYKRINGNNNLATYTFLCTELKNLKNATR